MSDAPRFTVSVSVKDHRIRLFVTASDDLINSLRARLMLIDAEQVGRVVVTEDVVSCWFVARDVVPEGFERSSVDDFMRRLFIGLAMSGVAHG